MQYALQVFEYEDHRQFRVVDIDGEPWFVLSDVCRALDLRPNNGSYYRHAERLDSDEKQTIPRDRLATASSPLGAEQERHLPQSALVVSESGLYSLILGSTKPEAKRFKKWITAEVLPAIRKTGGYNLRPQIPAFIRRFNDNWDRVDIGCFSVLNELVTRVWGRLEMIGHVMANHAPDGRELRIDVSVGRLFSDWLKKHHPTVSTSFSYYMHKTPEWEGEVRQYPNSMLPLFVEFVDTVWIPDHAEPYLRTRDPAALPHLPKLLPSPNKPKPGMTRRVTGRAPTRKAS